MNTHQSHPVDPHTAIRNLQDTLDRLNRAVGQLAAFVDQVPPLLPDLEKHLEGNGTREALIAVVSDVASIRLEADDLRRFIDRHAATIAAAAN